MSQQPAIHATSLTEGAAAWGALPRAAATRTVRNMPQRIAPAAALSRKKAALLGPHRFDGGHPRGAPERRNQREERGARERQRSPGKRARIGGADAEQPGAQHRSRREHQDRARAKTGADQYPGAAHDETRDIRR